MKDYLHGKVYAKNIVNTCIQRFHFIQQVPSEELNCCKTILDSMNHFKNERITQNIATFDERKERQKAPNQIMTMSGVHVLPLLQGKVPFSSLKKTHLPLVMRELSVREVQGIPADALNHKIKAMTKLLRKSMHDARSIEQNNEETKHFKSLFENAIDWDDDMVAATISANGLV